MADYSLVPNIPADIKAMMDDYFDAMHLQDMVKMWEEVREVSNL